MPTPLENAERRLAELRREIARVEQFIRDYHEFSAGYAAGTVLLNPSLDNGGIEGNVSSEDGNQPVDNSTRRKVRPDEIAQLIERVIREVGRPMTRGQLVEALERRDVDLPAADKARYIGTIIWRHKSIFVNVKGLGYYLRNMPQQGAPVAGVPDYEGLDVDLAIDDERMRRALGEE